MIVDYKPEHLLEIRHQPWQRGATQTIEHARTLTLGHCAYTALCDQTGRALICAGIIELWTGTAMCWASMDFECRPVMIQAHRRTMQELDRAPFKRLEMYVLPGFIQAWRWAEMLGFKVEVLKECGSPDSRDIFVFKRIKRGPATRRLN